MSATPETETLETAAVDEPFLGSLDIILLVGLLIGAVYYLLSKRKREETSTVRSYSIQ